MQFLYDNQSGNGTIDLKGENFNYLIKVRRHKENDDIALRSLEDPNELYIYTLNSIQPKRASLLLKEHKHLPIKSEKRVHIGWCVVDSASIEKVLPMLNEIGVDRVTFIYCARSQRNIKLNLERFTRVLNTSSMQCGRSTPMKISIDKSLDNFLQENKDTVIIDFSVEKVDKDVRNETFLIGCEGGFSEDERKNFSDLSLKKLGLDSPMILRSESAVVAISSKILL